MFHQSRFSDQLENIIPSLQKYGGEDLSLVEYESWTIAAEISSSGESYLIGDHDYGGRAWWRGVLSSTCYYSNCPACIGH